MKRTSPASLSRGVGISVLAGCAAMLLVASTSGAQTPAALAIERLEAAITAHPEDPDLAFALARRLAADGRASDAMRRTRDFVARWPDRRAEARVEIARAMIDAGDHDESLALLDDELRANPRSAIARLYRGIAFRSAGLIAEANREFAAAAQLAPALRPESLLAQALGLFELGKESDAVDLLREILEIDPTSESAIRARLLLRQREIIDLQRWWRLDAQAGFEWDDNVLLESATEESVGSDQEDFRGVWGFGATARALTTEKVAITLGYRFDQLKHHDLDRFDLLTNSGFASGSLQLQEKLIVRLDAVAWNTRRDGDNELTAGLLRPSLIWSLGPDWGVLRAFAQYQVFDYDEKPVIDAWERDGFSFGAGLEHFLPLPIKDSFLSTSVSYQQNLTQAGSGGGSLGIDGDNDHHEAALRIRGRVVLPAEINARIEAGYKNDRYHNNNFLNAFSTLRLRKREDDIASARIGFSREIVEHAEFEVYWRGTWRMSNISFFDYDQNVVGVLVRVTTD